MLDAVSILYQSMKLLKYVDCNFCPTLKDSTIDRTVIYFLKNIYE